MHSYFSENKTKIINYLYIVLYILYTYSFIIK